MQTSRNSSTPPPTGHRAPSQQPNRCACSPDAPAASWKSKPRSTGGNIASATRRVLEAPHKRTPVGGFGAGKIPPQTCRPGSAETLAKCNGSIAIASPSPPKAYRSIAQTSSTGNGAPRVAGRQLPSPRPAPALPSRSCDIEDGGACLCAAVGRARRASRARAPNKPSQATLRGSVATSLGLRRSRHGRVCEALRARPCCEASCKHRQVLRTRLRVLSTAIGAHDRCSAAAPVRPQATSGPAAPP